MAEGFKKADANHVIEINEILRNVIIPLPEQNGEKFCKYKKGWSDGHVAAKASNASGLKITGTMVWNVRAKRYGKINNPDRNLPKASEQNAQLQEALDRIDGLEQRLDHLIEMLGGEDTPKANRNGQYHFPLTAAK